MRDEIQNETLKNLQPNSKAYHKASQKKQAPKDIPEKPEKQEKIVTGKAVVKKKGTAKKVEEALLADDAKTVKTYLLWDVLIPAVKDTLSDLVKKGIDALLFGEEHRGNDSYVKRNGASSYVSYSSYYNRDRSNRYSRPRSQKDRVRGMDFGSIVYEHRGDAEEVLDRLVELTMMYGMASVADFYELSGMETNYMDNKFGWDELESACIRRTRDGYVIDLPTAVKLDDVE